MCGDCKRLDKISQSWQATREEREQDDIAARYRGKH